MTRNATANQTTTGRRHGTALIYLTILMTTLLAITSLAVDYGRVQIVKSQLQHGAETCARHGCKGLANVLYGESAAYDNAMAASLDILIDGQQLKLDATKDIATGIWTPATRSFVVNTDATLCNAVRVQAHRTLARGNPVTLVFAKLFGQATCDVNATAIAMLVGEESITYTIPDTSNPFLSGMPAGTLSSPNNPHKNPDYAGTDKKPMQSPVEAKGISVSAGAQMSFDGINGGANNDFHNPPIYNADGNVNDVGSNTAGSEHGIADLGNGNPWNYGAPLNSLVGVFLDDKQPDSTATPASLDFSSPESRNFQNLAPKLKQIFFIGDGRRDNGEMQTFTVPNKATRLFIATWDRYEWNNNVGAFQVTLHNVGTVKTVYTR